MIRYAKITVVFLEETTVAFKDVTLKEVVKQCLQYPLNNKTPLLIKTGADTKLYFNTQLMINWVQNEINFTELLEFVKVDNLARNKELLQTKKIAIDSDSLWLVKSNNCILVDDDLIVIEKLNDRFTLFN